MLKDTIISAFNYDGTLLKWLKKVEDALQNASASEFRVNKKGNATISFSIVFANGDTLESGDIVLQQGESVTGATIRQGHLILTLSNGDELDAGDLGAVTGFSINASQHLIVTYQNGTTQDLGAIFDGANIKVNTLTSDNEKISTLKPVVEVMTGYEFQKSAISANASVAYAGVVKNGNKVTLVVAGSVTRASTFTSTLGTFHFPLSVASKIIPIKSNYVVTGRCELSTDVFSTSFSKNYGIEKLQNEYFSLYLFSLNSDLVEGTNYMFRIEATFLLSDNLAE